MVDAGIPASSWSTPVIVHFSQRDPIEPDQELIFLSAAAHFSIEATTRHRVMPEEKGRNK